MSTSRAIPSPLPRIAGDLFASRGGQPGGSRKPGSQPSASQPARGGPCTRGLAAWCRGLPFTPSPRLQSWSRGGDGSAPAATATATAPHARRRTFRRLLHDRSDLECDRPAAGEPSAPCPSLACLLTLPLSFLTFPWPPLLTFPWPPPLGLLSLIRRCPRAADDRSEPAVPAEGLRDGARRAVCFRSSSRPVARRHPERRVGRTHAGTRCSASTRR